MNQSQRVKIKALRRKRQKLLQELSSLSLLIRGSFFQRFSTCSRPNCSCHKGQKHGPRAYVAVTQEKAQKQHYIPKQQVNAVQKGIRQYHRLLDIVVRISVINLELMRLKALEEADT
ncbi:hypothetical protein ES703_75784 [subsurface metagenome]